MYIVDYLYFVAGLVLITYFLCHNPITFGEYTHIINYNSLTIYAIL